MKSSPKIDYLKSCVGTIYFSDQNKQVSTTEILRYNKYEKQNDGTLVNNFLEQLLGNIKLLSKYEVFENEQYCYENPKIVYIGETTSNHVVRIKKISNHQYVDKPDEITKLCKITSKNREIYNMTKKEYTSNIYYADIKNDPSYKKYYKTSFWYETDDIIILPNIYTQTYPFNDNIIGDYDKLYMGEAPLITQDNIQINIDLIYNFLTQIKFNIFFKNRHFNDIFDFEKNKSENIELLKNIRDEINYYYTKTFFFEDTKYYNKYYLNIDVVIDKNYSYCLLECQFINKLMNIMYKKFSEIYRSLKLDDLIGYLSHNDPLSYYAYLTYKKDDWQMSKNFECLNDSYQRQYINYNKNEYINGSTFKNLFGYEKYELDIKVIQEFGLYNAYHSYCTEAITLAVKIRPKSKTKLYRMTIKSITYNMLKYNKQFEQKFRQKIMELKEMDMDNENVTTRQLPSIYEIMLIEIKDTFDKSNDNLTFSARSYIIETPHDYKKTQETNKTKCDIDFSVLLKLVWFRELGNIMKMKKYRYINKYFYLSNSYPQELDYFVHMSKILISNPIEALYLLDDFEIGENFIIHNKYDDNNLWIILYYVMWRNMAPFSSRFDAISEFKKMCQLLICNNDGHYEKDTYYKKLSIPESEIQRIRFKYETGRYIFDLSSIFELLQNYTYHANQKSLLWYNPENLQINNYGIFGKSLTMIKNSINYPPQTFDILQLIKYASDEKQKYSKKMYTQELLKSTNFYKLYQSPDFLHTVREIRANINTFTELDRIIKYNKTKYTSPLVIIHYPTSSKFNILHIHFNDSKFGMTEEQNNYYDVAIDRYFLWDNVKNIDMSNKTIVKNFRNNIKYPFPNRKKILDDISDKIMETSRANNVQIISI